MLEIDFETKRKEIKEAIDFGAYHIVDLEFDDKLYHYTSLDALQKIMESGVFRATEYHYLNDMDEFQNVDEIVFSVIEDVFKDCENVYILIGKVAHILREIQKEAEDLHNSYYVMSFSLAQDNLTLWTEFANYGCNLGLNRYLLQKGDVPKTAYSGYVLYTEEEKKAVIRNAICWVFAYYFDESDIKMDSLPEFLNELDEQQIEVVAESIAQLAFYYGMAMKDELYEAEKEYRVIFSGKGQPVYFRQRGNMMIPYIEVPLAVEDNFKALSSVTLAPLGKGDMQVRAMEQFLENLGLDGKAVFESRLNLRY